MKYYTVNKDSLFTQNNNPDYVSVEGIWLITSDHDKVLEQYDYPYGIKIACSRNTDHCSFQKTMIALLKYSDVYYLTTNESDFKIETWNKDAIIAINRFDSGLLGDCFIHILQINFHTQEVFVKSVLKNIVLINTALLIKENQCL